MPGGGWGAKYDSDGTASAVICINDGDNAQLRHRSGRPETAARGNQTYALRQDSGGPGQFRGGLGVKLRVAARPRCCSPHTWSERSAPHGESTAEKTHYRTPSASSAPTARSSLCPTAKIGNISSNQATSSSSIQAAAAATATTPPRPPTDVIEDVRRGYVSAESAIKDQPPFGTALFSPPPPPPPPPPPSARPLG